MQATHQQMKIVDRLEKRSDFLRLQREGTRWVSQGLILQAAPNGLDGRVRVGFTVTKKTEKSSVKRNRIKRRLRAAAADVLSLHAKPGTDYVLIGRTATATRPYGDLKNDLKWCLKRTGYLKDDKEGARDD